MIGTGRASWVRLTFVVRGGELFLGYQDSRGRAVLAPEAPPRGLGQAAWVAVPVPATTVLVPQPGTSVTSMSVESVRWPTRATSLILGLLAAMPLVRQRFDGRPEPTALAVFVRPPTGSLWNPAFLRLAHAVLDVVGVSQERSMLAAETRPGDLPPFALPFDVAVGAGDIGAVESGVNRLLGGLPPAERPFAMRVRSLPPALRGADRNADVLVTSTTDLLLPSGPGRPVARLVIADDPLDIVRTLQPETLPPGSAAIIVPASMVVPMSRFVLALLRELTHDLPLHEAVLATCRELELDAESRRRLRLYASPAGLDSLRLATAFEAFLARTRRIARYRSVGRGVDPTADVPVPSSARVDAAADRVREARNDFRRESAGLSEMARAEAAVVAASADLDAFDRVGASLLADADRADALAARQDRRVAMWLTHDLDALPELRHWQLGRFVALKRGGRYVLNVAVGLDTLANLVSPDVPPVDPILPPTTEAEHVLTVAVFSDTTTVVDAPAKQLRIPKLGPSETVSYRLQLPRLGNRTRIRVHVSYREHMVQAFVLDIALGAAEGYREDGSGVRTDLVYSRQEQIRDPEALPPRLLGFAVNEDRSGSHRLMFDSTGHAVRLSATTVDNARKVLKEQMAASFGALDQRGQLEVADFEKSVKAMAKHGHALWGLINDEGTDALQQHLGAVADADLDTVQVVRLESEFAFPWTMLYDWDLPATAAATDATHVCRGEGPAPKYCGCGPRTGRICVRGFWGVRLVIEELVRQDDVDKVARTVTAAPGVPPVVCTVGVPQDPWSKDMVDGLTRDLGGGLFEDFAANEPLLMRLWEQQRRPAILVAVGHLTKIRVDTERDVPRIYLRCAEGFLDTDALRQAKRDVGQLKSWQNPQRPIVLLLGCDTARSGLGEVHRFVTGLASAGASVVISTEEKIDTRLAADLTRTLVPGLGTTGVGEGLRGWRAGLMRRGNPLGLVFTCFGSADALAPQLVAPRPGGR